MHADINAIAQFAIENLDYSELYEDDAGTFDINETRVYFERKRNTFVLHVGSERFTLPRC